MAILIICALISGASTIYLTAPIMQTRAQTCYILMIFIPAFSLAGLFIVSPPHSFEAAPVHLSNSFDSQETALRTKLSQDPENATTILDLSGLYIAQERFTDAIALLRDAQRKHPENDDFALQLSAAHFAKGLLFAENNDYKNAIKSLQYAQAVAPENTPFLPDIEHFIEQLEKKIKDEGKDESAQSTAPNDAPPAP